jgi:hypothetical protein
MVGQSRADPDAHLPSRRNDREIPIPLGTFLQGQRLSRESYSSPTWRYEEHLSKGHENKIIYVYAVPCFIFPQYRLIPCPLIQEAGDINVAEQQLNASSQDPQ